METNKGLGRIREEWGVHGMGNFAGLEGRCRGKIESGARDRPVGEGYEKKGMPETLSPQRCR